MVYFFVALFKPR